MTQRDFRYQFQPWYVRLWRSRYRLLVPWYAVSAYVLERVSPDPLSEEYGWPPLSFKECWMVGRAMAASKMDHFWYMHELEAHIQKKFPAKIPINEADKGLN